MARNRKYQPASIRFGPALKALLLCALFCGTGVGYVWQKSQIDELARQIRKKEARLAELKYTNQKSRNNLAKMHTPRWINERVRELNLGMGPPLESQKLRLVEPVEMPPAVKTQPARLYAAQPARSPGMP